MAVCFLTPIYTSSEVQGKKKGYHSIKIKKFLCESDLYWRKEVTVKLNFAIHNVKNEVSFSLCKYWSALIPKHKQSPRIVILKAVCRFVVLLLSTFSGFSIFGADFSFAFSNFAHYCFVLLNAPLSDWDKKGVCNFPGNLDPPSLTPGGPVALLVWVVWEPLWAKISY